MSNVTNVFRDGTLVDVNVSYWSGAKALTPDDLGLDPSTLPEAYRLGKKFLIPSEVIRNFRSVEAKARRTVEENSFQFPIGHARFVPKKKFPKVIETLKELHTQYETLVEDLVANYEKYRAEMLPVYKTAAETAFDVSTPTGVQTFSIEDREAAKTAFVDLFLKRIEAYYPVAETLRARFSLAWDVYEVAMPLLKKGDAGLIIAKGELEQEWVQKSKEKIGNFVEDVVKALRAETVDLCQHVVQNITEGKIVKGHTIKSLRNFVERFQELNFVGDQTVEEQLNKLKKEFLDTHTYEAISEGPELQEELRKRLIDISTAASNVSDVSPITGEYKRQIEWDTEDKPVEAVESVGDRQIQWDTPQTESTPAPAVV